jgi:hypothetical protein
VRSESQLHSPGQVAPVPAHISAAALRREGLLAAVVILFSSFSYFLIQYDHMRTEGKSLEDWARLMLAGAMPAPVQYRIGLPLLTHFLELSIHIKVNQSLAVIEFLSYAFALTFLYLLFRASPQVQNAGPSHRFLLLGMFFAATQFPVLWIFPWERPETLPTAFYLSAIVLLVVRRGRMNFALVCLLTVLLSLAQALVRADVPFVVGFAVVLSAAIAIPLPRPRAHIAALGALCLTAGAATQFCLQHVVYPTVSYAADTPKFQLLNNLNPFFPPLHMPDFFTALLPFIVSVVLLRRYRLPLESSDKLVLLICLLYLPAWIGTGLMAEVRIFVPFLFLASPTIAKLWAAYLLNGDAAASPQPSA